MVFKTPSYQSVEDMDVVTGNWRTAKRQKASQGIVGVPDLWNNEKTKKEAQLRLPECQTNVIWGWAMYHRYS